MHDLYTTQELTPTPPVCSLRSMRALIITSLILAACGDDTTTEPHQTDTNNGTSNAELVEQCRDHCTYFDKRGYCPNESHEPEHRELLEDRCPGYTYRCPRELRDIPHLRDDNVLDVDDTCQGFCQSNDCFEVLYGG